MHDARVLVVDDSAAMRALFSDILDQAKGVSVVGTANNADDARAQIEQLRPNVVTLDVEMPGMSGIEFLEEIMESRPIPVVMLSSLTQSGTETSLKAFELGAVECFPKPLKVTPEQFAKTVAKLGKIVHAAANSNVRERRKKVEPQADAKPFEWNGHYVALCASMGGVDALTALLEQFPEHCPPTVVVLDAESALIETFITKMNRELPITVKAATDGAPLRPGHVYIAYQDQHHVVVEAGDPAQLRLVARDPVEGARPSATLLFASIARAGLPAVGGVLSGLGQDGAKGLQMMRAAGAATYAEDRATATFSETVSAAVALDAVDHELALNALAQAIVERCNAR